MQELGEYTKDSPLQVTDMTTYGEQSDEVAAMMNDGRAVFIGEGATPPPAPAAPGANPPAAPPASAEEAEALAQQQAFSSEFEKRYGSSPDSYQQSLVDLQESQQRNTELEGLAVSTQNPFASDTIAKMNALVKNGVSEGLAGRLITTDFKEISAEEALVIKMMKDSPNTSETVVRGAVRQKYGYSKDDEGVESYAQSDLMEVEASTAKVDMANLVENAKPGDDNALTEKLKLENKEKAQRLNTMWEPQLQLMKNSPLKASIQIGEGNVFDFDVPQAYVAENMETFKNHALGNGLIPNTEGLKSINDLIKNMYIIQNQGKILSQFEARIKKDNDALSHNGKPVDRGGQGSGGQEKIVSNLDAIIAARDAHANR